MQPLRNKALLGSHRAAVVVVACLATISALAEVKVGDTFPELTRFKLEGNLPSDIKGKIVIVDFWASWCGPCKESFPMMEELQNKHASQGVVVIAVSEDEKKANMDDFLKKNKPSFIVVRDVAPDGAKLVDKVAIPGMPASFILDGNGKVRFSHVGFYGAETKKKYEQEIQSLLKK